MWFPYLVVPSDGTVGKPYRRLTIRRALLILLEKTPSVSSKCECVRSIFSVRVLKIYRQYLIERLTGALKALVIECIESLCKQPINALLLLALFRT